jgi:hypothetical protein
MNITPDYTNLLSLLDRPIAFHRVFVTVTGSVLAGLMLSQGVYWHPRGSASDNWFYKTQAEWEKETGMSRYEQEGARKKLRQVKSPDDEPIWEEELRGVPAKMYYRVNVNALFGCIIQYGEFPHTSMQETSEQDSGNPTDLNVGNPRTFYSKTTTDISAKKGKRPTRAQGKGGNPYRPDEYADIII